MGDSDAYKFCLERLKDTVSVMHVAEAATDTLGGGGGWRSRLRGVRSNGYVSVVRAMSYFQRPWKTRQRRESDS